MATGPIVAGAPIEELMAMTVPELISWLTKNNITLPNSKQTKQYYRNLALQTPNLIMGGTLLGENQLTPESSVRRSRKKKDANATLQAAQLVDSPSAINTRSRQAAALRAQQEVPQGDNLTLRVQQEIKQDENSRVRAQQEVKQGDNSTIDITVIDKEIEMDFPTKAGEVLAAPESPAMSGKAIQDGHDELVGPKPLRKEIRKPKYTFKLYYMLPTFVLIVALIVGVLTQFYAFHVVIDPVSSKYQLSITPRSHQP